jgi:type III restriction enzyme
LLEVKGFEGEQETAKYQAAKRWVSAVNNWGRMGCRAFHVCKNPDTLRSEVEYLTGLAVSRQPAACVASVRNP